MNEGWSDFQTEALLASLLYHALTVAPFAVALTRQRRFNAFLLARLQIESVPLDFFDDVLLQNLALEAPERVLKGFHHPEHGPGPSINLIGVSAFPHGARRSQLDLIPEDSATFSAAAKAAGLKLSRRKSGFLIQGEDRPGAVADIAMKLAERNINVTSVQLFCTGSGRYGGMLWVKAPDLRRAAKAVGIA